MTLGQYIRAAMSAAKKAGHDPDGDSSLAGGQLALWCCNCQEWLLVAREADPEAEDPELAFCFLPCDWPTGKSVDYRRARLAAAR